jgi:hypothetical protein
MCRAADCDTDHYLVVAKVRDRLAVSKRTAYRVHMEMFNLKKLNEVRAHNESTILSNILTIPGRQHPHKAQDNGHLKIYR